MKKLFFFIFIFLGIMKTTDAQRSGYSNYEIRPGWNNNIQFEYGNANLYVPNGYHYYGLQNLNGSYFAQFQHKGQYYQQPIQWQQTSNGLRVATIVLNVVGSTLLSVSNSLQWGNSWNNNFYAPSQPYFYQNSPPIYYQNRIWGR